MRRTFARLVAAAACAWLCAAAQAGGDPLEPLRWRQRVFLVFSPSAADVRLDGLLRTWDASRCALEDRDVAIGVIVPDDASTLGGRALSAVEAEALRTRYAVPAQSFLFVLIGKDGGEKLRDTAPPSLDEVLRLIDGMPMRRSEFAAPPGQCD
jgi:hypothetical protein